MAENVVAVTLTTGERFVGTLGREAQGRVARIREYQTGRVVRVLGELVAGVAPIHRTETRR